LSQKLLSETLNFCTPYRKGNFKRCIFGYVVRDGCNDNDRPETGLLSLGILRSDPFMCPFLETLDFDFVSRIRVSVLYETTPKMDPVAVVKISQ